MKKILYSLFMIAALVALLGSEAFAQVQQSSVLATLKGRVTQFDKTFGNAHMVQETQIVLFPEKEIPYEIFGGESPANYQEMLEGSDVESKHAAYAHITPANNGYYTMENIPVGSYWMCNIFQDKDADAQMSYIFEPFPEAMFLWGCQYITLKQGQNKQDFYWNMNGFWVK